MTNQKYIVVESQETENAAKICYPAETMDDIERIVNNLINEGYCEPKNLQVYSVGDTFNVIDLDEDNFGLVSA